MLEDSKVHYKTELADGIDTVVDNADSESTARTVHRSNHGPLVWPDIVALDGRQLATVIETTNCVDVLIDTAYTCQYSQHFQSLQKANRKQRVTYR